MPSYDVVVDLIPNFSGQTKEGRVAVVLKTRYRHVNDTRMVRAALGSLPGCQAPSLTSSDAGNSGLCNLVLADRLGRTSFQIALFDRGTRHDVM
jgi:hypothetical protein